jgi:hypothetical protein
VRSLVSRYRCDSTPRNFLLVVAQLSPRSLTVNALLSRATEAAVCQSPGRAPFFYSRCACQFHSTDRAVSRRREFSSVVPASLFQFSPFIIRLEASERFRRKQLHRLPSTLSVHGCPKPRLSQTSRGCFFLGQVAEPWCGATFDHVGVQALREARLTLFN